MEQLTDQVAGITGRASGIRLALARALASRGGRLVLADVEASAQQWVETMRAGPFFLFRHIQLDELTYRGKPSTLDQSSAVGQWGTIKLSCFNSIAITHPVRGKCTRHEGRGCNT